MDHPAFHNSHPATTANCIWLSRFRHAAPKERAVAVRSRRQVPFAKKTLGLGGWWSENVWNIVQVNVFPPFSPGIWIENTNHTGWPMQMNMFHYCYLFVPQWHGFCHDFFGQTTYINLPWIKAPLGFYTNHRNWSRCVGWKWSNLPGPTCNSWFCGKHLQNLLNCDFTKVQYVQYIKVKPCAGY